MKKILILLIILVSNIGFAQHCPFDGAAIIVVKIHERDNENTIPNLKLTLVKKKKNKIIKTIENFPNTSYSFPFLNDEYNLIVGNTLDVENWYLKIESVCEYGDDGLMNYGTTEIKLTQYDSFSLCGNYDNTNYYDSNNGRVYSPIEVILSKKSCETQND